MTRRRSMGLLLPVPLALAGILAATNLLGPSPSGHAAPNPYGASSTTVSVTLDRTGGHVVDTTFRQELFREFDLNFGWTLPDHVRLPDDDTHPLPGLLMLQMGQPTGTVNGAAGDIDVKRTGHGIAISMSAGSYPAGDHTATLTVPMAGTTVIEGDQAISYIRVPGRRPDVTITSPGPITKVYCATWPPRRVPCGTISGSTATIRQKEHPERSEEDWNDLRVVMVVRPARDVKASTPVISHQ